MILLHGTNSLFLAQIREQGILPSGVTGKKCENRKGNHDVIFLTDKERFAAGYAFRSVLKHGGTPVIIKVECEEFTVYTHNVFIISSVPAYSIKGVIKLSSNNLIDDMVMAFKEG